MKCASKEEIEICITVEPDEERGLKVVESCGYCDENGRCLFNRHGRAKK